MPSEWYLRNRDRLLEQRRQRYLRNKEEVLKRSREYYQTHKDQYSDNARRRNQELKAEVIVEYGNVCVCCGEGLIEFLSIDHINNDGAEHRKNLGRTNIYSWLKANGFPKEGFQVLCMNCNFAKGAYGKCPHQE